MPRQGRINVEAGIYHVIQRGIERRAIFQDDSDREEFLRRLAEGLKETGHKCYGWVLMPNHFHLLIRTGARSLSDLMRKLLTGYALYFNKKYKRSGYVYQNRYKSILCQEDAYLLELVRYIHLNPIRAGIVVDMKGLGSYAWSGHAVYVGSKKAPWQTIDEILGLFGKTRAQAVKRYEEFIAAGREMGRRADLIGGGLIRSAGGWTEVLALRKSEAKMQSDERLLGDGDFVSGILKEADEKLARKYSLKKEGWDIDRVVVRVCSQLGVDAADIKRSSKRNALSQARSLVAYFANGELGITGVELSDYFGITRSSISSAIQRGREIAEKSGYRII